ncbi:hypothetical protein MSAN_00880000 [Mycena sanguinolenta]|uniref:Methyltransferase domain-containing protein n=1 Tax=Mycena sanguinolenta TaxID=230812 RepID=A0A8H6Z018_9AGAR|nr:hypothetical protein MSAN_00880000 [Mycena sanguinolenta]
MSQHPLAQHPRYLVLLSTILLGTVYLLYEAHVAAPKMQYRDLLPVTTNLSTTDSSSCRVDILPGGTTHLALTMQGSERRYQRMVDIREKFLVETGVIPNTAFSDWRSIPWDFFIPEFTCPFPMYRVGTVAEGGKWVCGLERVLLGRPNCIVYSLNNNSAAYSSFEVDMLQRSPGCQIHAFDFNPRPATLSKWAKWPWGDTTDLDTDEVGSRVHFSTHALANPTLRTRGSRSLKEVMKERGHEWIDILKIELNGAEFPTLLSIIAEYGGGKEPPTLRPACGDDPGLTLRRNDNHGPIPSMVAAPRMRRSPPGVLRARYDGCEQSAPGPWAFVLDVHQCPGHARVGGRYLAGIPLVGVGQGWDCVSVTVGLCVHKIGYPSTVPRKIHVCTNFSRAPTNPCQNIALQKILVRFAVQRMMVCFNGLLDGSNSKRGKGAEYSIIRWLPNEILWAIISEASRSDVVALCKTSRLMRNMATPLLYRAMELSTDTQIDAFPRTLKSPAASAPFCPCVRDFRIININLVSSLRIDFSRLHRLELLSPSAEFTNLLSIGYLPNLASFRWIVKCPGSATMLANFVHRYPTLAI